MNYRVTFRQDKPSGVVWGRTAPIPEQEARTLATTLTHLTGYPADIEPVGRPDLTTQRVIGRESGIESTPGQLNEEGISCREHSSGPDASASPNNSPIFVRLWRKISHR